MSARSVHAAATSRLPTSLALHVYDHCPFCNRVEFLMGKMGISYERVLYHYGEGADPAECGGTGFNPGGGPVTLTGKKMLPVLVGEGVPAPVGAKGMAESLEICSYLAAHAEGGSVIAPATGRPDVDDWRARFKEVSTPLTRPRITKVPGVYDWTDPQDEAYARWKYSTKFGFDYDAAVAMTPDLLPKASKLLAQLEGLLRGQDEDGVPCLNQWGFSMDDVMLLPDLRMISCVKGVEWPELVKSYFERNCGRSRLDSYAEHAVA